MFSGIAFQYEINIWFGGTLYCDVWSWTARNISMAGIPLALIVHITNNLPFTPPT
jgi:hypothetical protein